MKDLFVNHSPVKEKTPNAFLNASTKKDTRTANGALSNSSTGSTLVDQFAKAGSHRERSMKDVDIDMARLWADSPIDTLRFTFYLRLITRRVAGFYETEEPQRGQGNKDESLKRMLWIAYNHPEVFYANLWLVPLVGCWKDLWVLMGIDYKNQLDHSKFFDLMKKGLAHEDMKDMVLKYLPQIKAKSKCKTPRAIVLNNLAKEFAKHCSLSYREYREMKTAGVGHVFQQQISKGLFDDIQWNHIPGKALTNLVSGKFLANNKLEDKYLKWIQKQPTAKFSGYVYELYRKANSSKLTPIQKHTYDKQFEGLLQLAKSNNGSIKGNVWCALDTSGSMGCQVTDKTTALDICVSLGIYFSALNEGAFKDHVIMFDSKSKLLKLKGTFSEKCKQVPSDSMGSTNFQSVIDEIVRIRKQNPQIPIEDYPSTLLVVSDLQFNPSGVSYSDTRRGNVSEKTNYETAMAKLSAVGLPKITIVWWNVNGNTKDFPSTMDDPGTYMFSGFDGAVISTLLGGKEQKTIENHSMEDAVQDALHQEILLQLTIKD
jgi:hypothetical protein